jgi:hypothetical protein
LTIPTYRSKAQIEPKLRRRLRADLAPYANAAAKADRLIWALLLRYQQTQSTRKSGYACALLLARLSNDLRCVVHLSRNGYLLQAWGLGTSLIESAYSVGHIGADDNRATKWLSHTAIESVPWRLKEAVRSTLVGLDLPVGHEGAFYRNFRVLSSAKHPNPVVLTRYGVTVSEAGTRITVDPHYTQGIAVLLRLGMTYCLHALGLALWAFEKHHLDTEPLQRRVLALAQETSHLLDTFRDVPVEPEDPQEAPAV